MKVSKARMYECRERLQSLIKPGDTVYCTLRHVSRSGMVRVIDLHVIKDGEPERIGRTVADFLGHKYDQDNRGLRVSGCGMDMGFAVVYELSHKLFSDGFGCIGEKCPASDHSNGDRDYTPHGVCKDCLESTHEVKPEKEYKHWHSDGGYALKHRWI